MSTGGLCGARLERMHDVMARHVDSGDVPGLVTLISRHGDVNVDAIGTKAVGDGDLDSGRRVTQDEVQQRTAGEYDDSAEEVADHQQHERE